MISSIADKYEIKTDGEDWPVGLDPHDKETIKSAVKYALTDAEPLSIDQIRTITYGHLASPVRQKIGPSWDRIYAAIERALRTMAKEVWIFQ